jgi:hypothetical protein
MGKLKSEKPKPDDRAAPPSVIIPPPPPSSDEQGSVDAPVAAITPSPLEAENARLRARIADLEAVLREASHHGLNYTKVHNALYAKW